MNDQITIWSRLIRRQAGRLLVALTGGLIWFGAVLLTGPNPAVAQTNYFFTNATTTAQSWSFSIWSNTLNSARTGPTASGGSNDYLITFNGNATFDATNDLGTAANSGFQLNRLIFNAGTPTLYGSNLVFLTSSTGIGPQLLQNTANNLIINNGLVFSNTTIFSGGGAGALTLNGALSGNGGLIKTNSGKLTLNAASTYAGGTVVNAGTLEATVDYAFGSGAITVNANALQLDTGRSAISSADSNTPLAITLATGTKLLLASTASTNYGNNIVTGPGAGTVTINSGNSGANNTLGNLTINGAQTLSTGGNNYNGNTLTFGTVSLNGGVVFDMPNTSSAQVQTWKLGAVSEFGGSWTVTKNNVGTLIFTTNNNYSGGTVLNVGVLEAVADYSLGRGAITVNGGVMQLDTGRSAISSADSNTPLAITLAPGGTLKLASPTSTNYGNNIATAPGAGTVVIVSGNSGAANTLGNLTINGAQTISAANGSYAGNTLTFGTVSMLGNAVFDLPNTSSAQGQTWRLGTVGEIGGNWTLTKSGVGTLTFTTVNNYSGGTVINGGVVEAAADYSMGRGPITVNSTLQLDTTRGAISSLDTVTPLPLTMAPGSWLTLSPSTGAIYGNNISTAPGAGTVTIHSGNGNANNTLGNVSIGYSGGIQTLYTDTSVGGNTLTFGNFTLSGNTIFDLRWTSSAQLQTWNVGAVSETNGSWSLTKSGSGSPGLLIMTNATASTYSGGTVVNGGTLQIASDGNLGAGGGALTLNGATLKTLGGMTFNNRAVSLGSGGGTLEIADGTTVTVTNNFTGLSGGAGTHSRKSGGKSMGVSRSILTNRAAMRVILSEVGSGRKKNRTPHEEISPALSPTGC